MYYYTKVLYYLSLLVRDTVQTLVSRVRIELTIYQIITGIPALFTMVLKWKK